jgi:hypothetical protein
MDPWRVSDADGRVLPMWLDSRKVYAGKRGALCPGKQAVRSRSRGMPTPCPPLDTALRLVQLDNVRNDILG